MSRASGEGIHVGTKREKTSPQVTLAPGEDKWTRGMGMIITALAKMKFLVSRVAPGCRRIKRKADKRQIVGKLAMFAPAWLKPTSRKIPRHI